MDALKVVGTNIAYLRDALGLSQQQVAEYLGVNRVEISYFENGQRPIPNSKITKLADLAGINSVELRSEQFSRKPLEVNFAFRSDGFELNDLQTISEFQRIARTYLRFKRLKDQKDDI
jgi:transcriptional regulator with XRE-family HTH domain